MRVFLLNRFYLPDSSATSQIAGDLCAELARRGFSVEAITSRQRHDETSVQFPLSQTIDGVHVRRVKTTRFGRAALFGRALDYLTFYLSATLRICIAVRRGDIVIVMTDPPMLSVPVAMLLGLREVRVINWLQDVFPEVAERLGVISPGPMFRAMRMLRNWSLRAADCNVVIGDHMAVAVQKASAKRPAIIPNWALNESIGDPGALRQEWGLAGRFVVGYSGNLGRAHQLSSLIEAAAILRTEQPIAFLLIGEGAQKEQLEARTAELGLASVQFRPLQPRERLSETLALPDIHVVSLDPRVEGLIVPSKFVGVIALGKPVLWLGDPKGEIGSLIEREGCGVVADPLDAVSIASAIRRLAGDAPGLARMSAAATALWNSRFRREVALRQWCEILASP